ncbi:MAG: hypothetical protein ACP5D2_04835 [Candidatus Nanoarchaeia archaeon]
MEGFDLRKFQEGGEEHDAIKGMLGKLVSGRDGYETVIEKRKEVKKCASCGKVLDGDEKFCPECGEKQA